MGQTEFSGRLWRQNRRAVKRAAAGVGGPVIVRRTRLVGVLEGEKSRQLCGGEREGRMIGFGQIAERHIAAREQFKGGQERQAPETEGEAWRHNEEEEGGMERERVVVVFDDGGGSGQKQVSQPRGWIDRWFLLRFARQPRRA